MDQKLGDHAKLGVGDCQCQWGMHIVGLYETEAERDKMLFGFVSQGIKDGDEVFYSPSERSEEDFREKFGAYLMASEGEDAADPRVHVYKARDFYFPSGNFVIGDVENNLKAVYDQCQLEQPKNVRATAEMTWSLDNIPGWQDLMAYEARVNHLHRGRNWISVCLYNVSKFSGSIIMNVLRTHPFVLSKGALLENPYFVDPDTWLRDNRPEYAIA